MQTSLFPGAFWNPDSQAASGIRYQRPHPRGAQLPVLATFALIGRLAPASPCGRPSAPSHGASVPTLPAAVPKERVQDRRPAAQPRRGRAPCPSSHEPRLSAHPGPGHGCEGGPGATCTLTATSGLFLPSLYRLAPSEAPTTHAPCFPPVIFLH